MDETTSRSPAPAQVDVPIRPDIARVRRGPQLPDQPELLEPCLELAAEDTPLDPVDGSERGLHGGPLAVGAEVRAQAGAQVARAADVEHELVPVAKEVDAGPRGRAVRERALGVNAPRAGSRQLVEVRQRSRASLLRLADQAHEHLGGRERVRERPVAGLGRSPVEVRERGESDSTKAAAEQPAREGGRIQRGSSESPARHPLELPVEE